MKEEYVIFLNGNYPLNYKKIKEICKNRKIIAVDGGANFLNKININPHLIIGDMDSIDKKVYEKYKNSNIEINESIREKDYTDFELAILTINNQEYHIDSRFKNKEIKFINKFKIIVFGATGKRIDMTLSNLKKLQEYDNLIFYSEEFEEIKYIDFSKMIYIDKKEKGSILSIVPITDIEGLNIEGLKYNLKDYNAKINSSFVSNEFENSYCKIFAKKGSAYIIIKENFKYI